MLLTLIMSSPFTANIRASISFWNSIQLLCSRSRTYSLISDAWKFEIIYIVPYFVFTHSCERHKFHSAQYRKLNIKSWKKHKSQNILSTCKIKYNAHDARCRTIIKQKSTEKIMRHILIVYQWKKFCQKLINNFRYFVIILMVFKIHNNGCYCNRILFFSKILAFQIIVKANITV